MTGAGDPDGVAVGDAGRPEPGRARPGGRAEARRGLVRHLGGHLGCTRAHRNDQPDPARRPARWPVPRFRGGGRRCPLGGGATTGGGGVNGWAIARTTPPLDSPRISVAATTYVLSAVAITADAGACLRAAAADALDPLAKVGARRPQDVGGVDDPNRRELGAVGSPPVFVVEQIDQGRAVDGGAKRGDQRGDARSCRHRLFGAGLLGGLLLRPQRFRREQRCLRAGTVAHDGARRADCARGTDRNQRHSDGHARRTHHPGTRVIDGEIGKFSSSPGSVFARTARWPISC